MKINIEKLRGIINELSSDIDGSAAYKMTETSVLIGEINGKPVQLTVFCDFKEADYSESNILPKYKCVEV